MPILRRRQPAELSPEAISAIAAEVAKAIPPVSVPAAPPLEPFEPLPRDDFPAMAYGPGVPLIPTAIDPREPGGRRPEPRQSQFRTSVNIAPNGERMVPFATLRDVAEKADVARRCIEHRKAEMQALDWDVTLTRHATKRIMTDDKITSPGKAAQIARERFEPDMARIRQFFEVPDKFNGLDWSTWLGMLLEEQLVVDAVTVWPRRAGSDGVQALELLDGATIKPLLDHRGSTPLPPNPAYQQILHGLPRGEFTATSIDVPTYRSDQLLYAPRVRRTWTPYGLPEVEQALNAVDLYLRRIGWIRGEFTEGATPATWIKSVGTPGANFTPQHRREWEVAMNAELAGDTNERFKLKVLPPGFEPEQMRSFAEMYQPALDELLIKLVCLSFGVMPTEVGFPPASGIGGKGHQEGEENSAYRKSIRPTAEWVGGLVTRIARTWLGMPPELQVTFLGYQTEDQTEIEGVADSQVRGGRKTINEYRAEVGQPLFEFAEADMPFIATSAGLVFIDGSRDTGQSLTDPTVTDVQPVDNEPGTSNDPTDDISDGVLDPETPEEGDPIADDAEVPDGFIRVAGHIRRKRTTAAAVAEAEKFLRFVTKRRGHLGRPGRAFVFEHLDAATANELLAAPDVAAVEDLVKVMRRRRPGKVHADTRAELVKTYDARLSAAAAKLINPTKLIAGWNSRDEDKAPAPDSQVRTDARQYVARALGLTDVDVDTLDLDEDDLEDLDLDDLDDEADDMITAGHTAGWSAVGLDPDLAAGSRLDALRDGLKSAVIAAVIGKTIEIVANSLARGDDADALAAILDEPFAETIVSADLTVTLSAGLLDGCEAAEIARVQISASAGDCEFCQGYDGRILDINDDSGMPPLHRGCACDLEPLE
jgi:hypothetical protein